MKKIYVGNLASHTTEQAISALFESYGPIVSCTLMKDRYTQESRGFAFVELEDSQRAAEAIRDLASCTLDGNQIHVNEARPKTDDNRRSFGGGGYGNSYGDRRSGGSDRRSRY